MPPRRSTIMNMTGFQVELRNEEGRRTWLDYPTNAGRKIKLAYDEGMDEVEIKLSINGRVNAYTICFTKMLQISKVTGRSRKLRAPYESSKYNAEIEGPTGEGLAGEDAGGDVGLSGILKRQLVPAATEVKIDPKLNRRDQVKNQFKDQKVSPTADNVQKLVEEAKKAECDKDVIAEITAFLKVIGDVEQAMAEKDLKRIPSCIAACKSAGCGAEYIEGLKKMEMQARVAAGRKIIANALEKTRETKGKTKEELDAMMEVITPTIEEVLALGLGEEEVRSLRDRKRKLWNAIQDLRGAIRVYCRTRPPNQRENDMGFKSALNFHPDGLSVGLINDEGDETTFSFDTCLNPGTQSEVFLAVKDTVQSFFDGYNVTLFAYGQTGSGKTFTMYGPVTNKDALNNKDSGVVINSIKEMYKLKKEYEQTSTVTLRVSMVELYLAKLTDLLFADTKKAPVISVRKAADGEVNFENAIWKDAATAEELWGAVYNGFENRKVTATAMNSESSRSHLLLNIKVEIKNKSTGAVIKGKMTMVDLAGSERVKDSRVEGKALEEAIEINKSLTCLGDVMEQLVKPKKGQQVGYRNSKLTECLQDCLGGTSKTLMFANVSPAVSNAGETLMTLKWAARANKVVNEAQKEEAENVPARKSRASTSTRPRMRK